MSTSTRSYYACLTASALLVALTAIVFGWTIPELIP